MCTFADMLVIIIDFTFLFQRVCDCFCWSFVFPIFLSGLTHLPTNLRHPSSSPSSSPWERWPICQCPACRQEACCGLQTWRHQILFIFCRWPSLERCSSSWRWTQISYFPKEIRQQKESDGKKLLIRFITIFFPQLGAESGIDNPNLRAMKTVFRIMPLVIFPLTINFPTVSESFAHICYCSHIVKKNIAETSLYVFFLCTNFRQSLPTGWPQTASPCVKWLCSDTP